MAISAESCRVALLGRDDGARRQLRDALQEFGAAIAFEGEPSAASGPSALGASLDVVIVNLEEGLDDALDHLQAVLDDPAINVVFNDADASRSLEGWDLARWARHLAAKVLGHGETMPPVPEGAGRLRESIALFPDPGPRPTPADLAPEADVTSFIEEAVGVSASVPVDALPDASGHSSDGAPELAEEATVLDEYVSEQPKVMDPALDIDFDLLTDALGLTDAPAPERVAPTPEAVATEYLAPAAGDGFSDGVVQAFSEEPVVPHGAGESSEPGGFEADGPMPEVDFSHEPTAAERIGTTADAPDAASLADDALDDAEIERALGLDVAAPERESLTPRPEAGAAAAEEFLEFSWEFGEDAAPDAFAATLDGDDGAPGAAPAELPHDFAANDAVAAEYAASRTDDQDVPGITEAVDEFTDSDAWTRPPATAAAGRDGGFGAESWSLDDGVNEDEAAFEGALDDDVAALAAQLDAFEAPEGEGVLEDLDFSSVDAPGDDIDTPAAADAAANVPAENTPAAGGLELSLAPLDDASAMGEPDARDAPEEKATYDFGNLDQFSLEPIEGEEADPLMVAMGLVDDPVGSAATATATTASDASPLGHVFVLGASIGGPDAVRTFLSALPADLPAVFLLVQHLESGYFERLAQQLQKASALPVRIASAELPAKKGEVLVISAAEHVVLETDGTVVASPHETPPRYTPSIDTVLQDVADRFGRHATAIIFSGMAGDAVEGAAYLTTKGGEVWAQDPQSCVVSSMVDGAHARGVVEFTGSPRELAQRCVARLAR